LIKKRAQRALGRSPEEKVTGHSGANNREPQGHNLNNFGRGNFDDVIYLKGVCLIFLSAIYQLFIKYFNI